MSRLLVTSDLHLGHRGIIKYRNQFSSEEEHSNTLFENLATSVGKRDTLYLLGDIAFTKEWLEKIKSIKCQHKLLICGNHDLERGIKMKDLVNVYDDVKSLYSKRNCWWSHCPIHPQEMRGRKINIHGHLHNKKVMLSNMFWPDLEDQPYFNACVEHTDYKPISFEQIMERVHCH